VRKSPPATVLQMFRDITATLAAQAEQMNGFQQLLNLQTKRIAAIQAELDVLPAARRRRKMLRVRLQPLLAEPSSSGNGHKTIL